MSIDPDRRLFEIFRPEGVRQNDDGSFSRSTGRVLVGFPIFEPWSPSTNWSDIEPLIERACEEHEVGWWSRRNEDGLAFWFDGQPAGRPCPYDGLPAAAALALIEMYESKGTNNA